MTSRAGATGAAISARALRRDFSEQPVLRGVSLTLAAGETLVVLGPTGPPKSTLSAMLATLLRPTRASSRCSGPSSPRPGVAGAGEDRISGHDPPLWRPTLGEALPSTPVCTAWTARRIGLPSSSGGSGSSGGATSSSGRSPRPASAGRGLPLRAPPPLPPSARRAGSPPRPGRARDRRAADRPGGGITRVVVTHDVEGGLGRRPGARAAR